MFVMLHTEVFIECFGELVECRWDLESLLEDPLLPLKLNGLGPLDEAREVSLRRQRATDPELLRPLLEQRVHHFLRLLLLRCHHWCFSTALGCLLIN